MIIIMILMQDKFKGKKIKKDDLVKEKYNPQLLNIMGQPRPSQSQRVPNKTFYSQESEVEMNPSHLDIEYDANENIISQDRQEKQDYMVNHSANLEEEEELSLMYRRSNADSGFAQGVTFEELSDLGIVLQKEKLKSHQKEIALSTIQKIQGTELFELLENSMESASGKIAALVDSSSLSNETNPSLMRNDNFSIDDFI